jgi:hypothetical protein
MFIHLQLTCILRALLIDRNLQKIRQIQLSDDWRFGHPESVIKISSQAKDLNESKRFVETKQETDNEELLLNCSCQNVIKTACYVSF